MKQVKQQINEYDQQAIDFLESTQTDLTITYLYTGKYFVDDKEERDIYQFTLSNARGAYSAQFGDSIHNTERRIYASKPLNNRNHSKGKRLGFKNGDRLSIAEIKATKAGPSSYDILSCLDSYTPDTFEEFCDEFGYNELPLSDHDKVMSIFLKCKEQATGLKRIFSNDQSEQLGEIS